MVGYIGQGNGGNRPFAVESDHSAGPGRNVRLQRFRALGPEFPVKRQVVGPGHYAVAAGRVLAGRLIHLRDHGPGQIVAELVGRHRGGIDGLVPDGIAGREHGAVPPADVRRQTLYSDLNGITGKLRFPLARAVALVGGGTGYVGEPGGKAGKRVGHRRGGLLHVVAEDAVGNRGIVAGEVRGPGLYLVAVVVDKGEAGAVIAPGRGIAFGLQPLRTAAPAGTGETGWPAVQVGHLHRHRAHAGVSRVLARLGRCTSQRGGDLDLRVSHVVERKTHGDHRRRYVVSKYGGGVSGGIIVGVVQGPGRQGIDNVVLEHAGVGQAVPGSGTQLIGYVPGLGGGLPFAGGPVPVPVAVHTGGGNAHLGPLVAGQQRVHVAVAAGEGLEGQHRGRGYGHRGRGGVHDEPAGRIGPGAPVTGPGIVGEAGVVHSLDLQQVFLVAGGPGDVRHVVPVPGGPGAGEGGVIPGRFRGDRHEGAAVPIIGGDAGQIAQADADRGHGGMHHRRRVVGRTLELRGVGYLAYHARLVAAADPVGIVQRHGHERGRRGLVYLYDHG